MLSTYSFYVVFKVFKKNIEEYDSMNLVGHILKFLNWVLPEREEKQEENLFLAQTLQPLDDLHN